ncbi:dsRBD fold-containing protein [Amycolatopsis sp. NPDC026612]|uniref:dsRBD fold-containing protein n=1 Tax=Amycolatopsis sp. NPDC026612 TaxID=3155466 RepID=UPI0033D77399
MDLPARKWSLDAAIEYGTNRTRAQIVLRTPDGQEFSGVGVALRTGPEQVASYPALGRALSDLTEELVEAATAELDVEAERTQHT